MSGPDPIDRGAQLLRSEIEVSERRALLRSAWGHRVDQDEVDGVLRSLWFQGLSLGEVEEASAIVGWTWATCLYWEHESGWFSPPEPALLDLVEFMLHRTTSGLVTYAKEWVWDDLCEHSDQVTETLAFLRRLANSYGFSLADMAHRVSKD